MKLSLPFIATTWQIRTLFCHHVEDLVELKISEALKTEIIQF